VISKSVFATNYQDSPYWWDGVPSPESGPVTLPGRIDVAIVGSGYTGLAAALELARAGRRVLVLDAERLGWDCSSRNGGQVSTSLKPSLAHLRGRHGDDVAFRIRREGLNALAWISDFIEREGIVCDWGRVGRFHGAHNASSFRTLVRDAIAQPKGLEVEISVVPRADQ